MSDTAAKLSIAFFPRFKGLNDARKELEKQQGSGSRQRSMDQPRENKAPHRQIDAGVDVKNLKNDRKPAEGGEKGNDQKGEKARTLCGRRTARRSPPAIR